MILKILRRVLAVIQVLLVVGVGAAMLGFPIKSFLPRPPAEKAVEEAKALHEIKNFAGVVAAVDKMPALLGRELAGREGDYAYERYSALLLRGDARVRMGRGDLAAADFEAARRIDYDAWDAYYGLGLAFWTMPDGCEGALRELGAALNHGPSSLYPKEQTLAEVHHMVSECSAVRGAYPAALQAADHELAYLESAPSYVREGAAARRALYQLSAVRLIDYALNNGAYYPPSLYLSGNARTAQMEAWRREYENGFILWVKELAPDASAAAYLARARIRVYQKDLKGARSDLEQAGRDTEVRSWADYWIAKAEQDLAALGPAAARPSLKAALRLRAKHAEAEAFLKSL